jgi:hypothetical protein
MENLPSMLCAEIRVRLSEQGGAGTLAMLVRRRTDCIPQTGYLVDSVDPGSA